MNFEWVSLLYVGNAMAQVFDVANEEIIASSFKKVEGEKVGPSRVPYALVVRHGQSMNV